MAPTAEIYGMDYTGESHGTVIYHGAVGDRRYRVTMTYAGSRREERKVEMETKAGWRDAAWTHAGSAVATEAARIYRDHRGKKIED